MKRGRIFIRNAAVLILVSAALIAGFFLLFEKAEKTVTTPGSAEARQNPFLAAERFLSQCGIPAESSAQRQILMQLPPPDTLIFIHRLGGNLPRKREDRLIEWIRNGGTLMITHDRLWRKRLKRSGNNLLDRLGVRQYDARELSDEKASRNGASGPAQGREAPPDSGGAADAANPWSLREKEVVRVPVGPDTFAKVRFIARYVLEDASKAESKSYGGKTGSHMIDRRMGKGRLIVLSDNEFLQNANIGNRDHAFYLACLAHDRGRVFIQYKSRMPSFFAILWARAPFFIISLLLFAVFYILWLTIRIGPRYPTGDAGRRDITEHFLAAGGLKWRYDPGGLINESRTALWHQWEKKMAARSRFRDRGAGAQNYAALARQAGLSKEAVVSAMTAEIDRPAALVKATAVLQQIHSALTAQQRSAWTAARETEPYE